ncbi:MAG: asparagine synthase (glutamine-hydrolyzing) [bacterium]
MCGILLTSDNKYSKKEFLSALELLHHRGPDAMGYVKITNIQIGHKRLKILDMEDRSNQPFYSRDERHVIIFNGEIYNYRELAREHNITPLKTTSDTEVIVELYAKYGPKFLQWLNGMFAFIILDTITQDIFVARDRLGVKPLYIYRRNGELVLSSEIAPILKLTGCSKADPIGLRQYLKLRTFFNGRTAYEGVEMFPAGCYMLSGHIHRYWQFPETYQDPPTDDELRQLIIESVQQRLISDVPVGSYLSGGLDSTIIAALAQKPHTWTVGFTENNEFKWARLASKHINSEHHEVLITSEEFVTLGRWMIKKRREPLSVPNEILLYKMTSEVKKENTVILSGEGADELFFGYDRIFRWASEAKTWDVAKFTQLYAYGSHNDLEIVEDALCPFMHRKNPLDIVAHFFQVAHLHGLLRRLDNSTMLCSVEARVPFVDCHPLIERMAGVAFSYRMKDGEIKSPLKRIFRDLIPEPIIRRKKVGFPVPLDNISFGLPKAATPVDQWLEFNLSELFGADINFTELKGVNL